MRLLSSEQLVSGAVLKQSVTSSALRLANSSASVPTIVLPYRLFQSFMNQVTLVQSIMTPIHNG